VSVICIAPVGAVESPVLEAVEACLAARFEWRTRQLAPLPNPDDAHDPQRHQYSSPVILRRLVELVPPDAARLLGVLDRDIFIPMLTFLFGQAQLGGQVALISLTRLRQEFYGLPPDSALLIARARKEALHEIGHTFGLTHCDRPHCTMALATVIEQVDAKSEEFCGSCRRLLRDSIAPLRGSAQEPRDTKERP
jgi:archaemetzincin